MERVGNIEKFESFVFERNFQLNGIFLNYVRFYLIYCSGPPNSSVGQARLKRIKIKTPLKKQVRKIYILDDEDQDEPGAENDCGDCWEADENGDCVPEAGRITTICGPDSIKMTIESCVFGEKYEAVYIGVDEAVYVGSDHDDSNCRLTYDQSYHESYGRVAYSLEHGLSDCGMTMNYDSDSIVFRVSLT